MHVWTITTLESTATLREGTSSNPTQAWKDAIDAALDELMTRTPDGFAIVMDGVASLLTPGRTADGQLDLPAIRAAAERMALAVIGGLA